LGTVPFRAFEGQSAAQPNPGPAFSPLHPGLILVTRFRPNRELGSAVLFAPPVNRLITELARLPGIGQRTAQRLAFHILSASGEDALPLADAIREVKETVGQCEVCFNLATESTCRICQDERREAAVLCVVEQPSDVIPIERTNEFHGRYHVLGGALSPIDGVDPEDLHIGELLARVSNGNGVREVVIATNATTTGEATALHLADSLRERAPDVAVTRLASGLPVGADLEYADEITLGRAFRSRQAL
jgi:recombination protein RecR